MEKRDRAISWSVGSASFFTLHVCAFAVFWTGWSEAALAAAAATYLIRMFAITGGYHRYFSHASYRTSRAFQFALGWIGASAVQKGPLWWAGHHRGHHLHADTEKDIHSPVREGFWWAHVGWILSDRFDAVDWKAIKEFARFPELRFLDEWFWLPPAVLAAALYVAGAALKRWAPGLDTNGPQMLAWGFAVSTVALYHATFSINSLAHRWGRRRFRTSDESRNNVWLAVITLGEGWHNNHHRCQYSERQGFFWWEVDMTHYALVALAALGVVWDLRGPARDVYADAA
ncbi:MAG: acyl-CoA desaturase [Elusimicrobia bacterium]|nr:acyl-CoA desaturase [Elusimicrobiota bacterium]